MNRIITIRYSEGIRMIARQKPNLFRYQHEKVRLSENVTPNVAKPIKEEIAGSIPFIPLQGADDNLSQKKSSKIKSDELEESSKEDINTGKQYWKTFYRKYETGTLSSKDFFTLFKGVYSEAQYQKFQEAPSAAYTISCVGLLPLCSIGIISLITGGSLPWLAYVQLTYSASVLSFLGGINWGHAIHNKKITMENLGWAVTPPVLAWSAVLLPLPIGFAFTAAGLTASLIHDILLTTYPQWFKSLRYILTVVALLSLLPTFFMTALKF